MAKTRPEPSATSEPLIERVLGAPREFTSTDVAAAAGLGIEDARQYWRAMGFADVGDARAFTKKDIKALRTVAQLVASGVVSQSEAVEIIRSLGQNTSRMADWQTGTIARLLNRHGEVPDDTAMSPEDVGKVGQLATALMPSLQDMLVYAWRRQLAAAMQRSMDTADAVDEEVAGQQCVGFADLVGFTRLSRRLPDERLAALVTTFEGDSADVVAATGARLIKTLGDEVMFAADSPEEAVETALRLHETHADDEDVPKLRIGLSFGEVVTRMGDLYGSTVNMASRLTVLARPGATLVDQSTFEGVEGLPGLDVRPLRPRILRGLGAVRAWSVSRAG
jgi:adenylate cyclase